MTERVEEIRRWHENSGHRAYFPHCETCKVVTALAQAERERDKEKKLSGQLAYDVEELRAEVERLKGQENWDGEVERLRAIRDSLQADLARVRAALAHYADRANYDGTPSAIDMDDGEVARVALEG